MINNPIDIIKNSGVIAISRGNYGVSLIKAAEALVKGGVRAVEVTFEQGSEDGERKTADAIASLVDRFGDKLAVGAGTVLTERQLIAAKSAGAQYVISPNTDERIIKRAKELGVGSIPGAMTPSEIANAYAFGADIVKLFPAGQLGAAYFAAVRTPLRHIPIAAVGGIDLDNICDFRRAGACAFGISSSLFNKKLIEGGHFDEIASIAAAFVKRASQKEL